MVLLLALAGCGGMPPLQVAQTSHDYLALTQDDEAQLCWGVSDVPAAIAANVPPTHCTSPVASAIGLTDQRHQAIQAALKRAFDEHRAIVTLLASGVVQVDLSALKAAVQAVIALVAQLAPTDPTVATMQVHLQKASPR